MADQPASPKGSDAPDPDNTEELDDIKAKMREALERKKSNDTGVDEQGHTKERPPETHGPQGGVHMHRRKAGGGGA